MAATIIKTTAIALCIRPFSRTSHVVTWLSPQSGLFTTIIKGAVRPKSFFLGQYDLFYTCEVLYYAHGETHAIREVTPLEMREGLRGAWRAVVLAGYVAEFVRTLMPSPLDAQNYFDLTTKALNELTQGSVSGVKFIMEFELAALRIAGLAPDFTHFDASQDWQDFALDLGHYGTGARTCRLSRTTSQTLIDGGTEGLAGALRFLGIFIAYHLPTLSVPRREIIATLRNSAL